MPSNERFTTKYPGVFYIVGTSIDGKPDRIYYIRYRRNGRMIEEKAGRQSTDDMTPARASRVRAERIEGREVSNRERRQAEIEAKLAEASKWTVDRLWETYKVNNPTQKGRITDQNRYENHIKSTFGKTEPVDIAPLDVDRLRLRLLKTKSPGTVKNVLELLRRICNFGVRKNLCPGPPFVIQMPAVNNMKTEDLDPSQLEALLQAIEADSHPQAGVMMKMALFTGMRRGEIFRLMWSDVDFKNGFITLRDPKGGQDQKIPLNDAARNLLEHFPRAGHSPFVFPGRGGRQRTDINKPVSKIKAAAGLPENFRALHGLRHVYASMLASTGQVDLYTLQKLLTHKSPQMTQRYAHLRDDALRKASNLAGDIIMQAVAEREARSNETPVKTDSRA